MHRARAAAYDIAFFIALLFDRLGAGRSVWRISSSCRTRLICSLRNISSFTRCTEAGGQLAYLLAFQLGSMLAVIVMSRRQPRVFFFSPLALLWLSLTRAKFRYQGSRKTGRRSVGDGSTRTRSRGAPVPRHVRG